MSVANSTARTAPSKPYPEFPLFAHATGYWAKKIRGKTHYFGPWADSDGALANYLAQKDDLHAGRKPRADTERLTLKELANAFLAHKQALVDAGELTPRMWRDYRDTGAFLLAELGKQRVVIDLRPDDFAELRRAMAKRWGLHRLAKMIQYTRSIFKFGFESELMDRPVRVGPGFARPTKKAFRIERASKGPMLFTAEEIRRLIGAAGIPLKAMLLLAINAGFGNSDCANLPLSALDMDGGWVSFPRPKTGIARRCKLWPETVAAIKDVLAKRLEPKDTANKGLLFITKYGLSWGKDTSDNPVAKETAKLLRELHIGGRVRLGFYTLRHTFRTVADEAKDQPATDHIMGHESAHMSSHYREGIHDRRLIAVSDYVRAWLFGAPGPLASL